MAIPALAIGLGVGGATLINGLLGASAANKAAKAQAKANAAATAEAARQFDAQMDQYRIDSAKADQRYITEQALLDQYRREGLTTEEARYRLTQERLTPYISSGTDALYEMRNLLGLGNKQVLLDTAESAYQKAIAEAKSKLETARGQYSSPVNTQEVLGAKTKAEADAAAAREKVNTNNANIERINAEIAAIPSTGSNSVRLQNIAKADKLRKELKTYTDQSSNLSSALNTAEAALQSANANYASAQQQEASAFTPYQQEYDQAIAAAEAQRAAAIEAANSSASGAESQRLAIANIENSPEMQALSRQGETAILSNASATGGLRGGNVQGALAEFRPSLLSDLINKQYERLSSLSAIGQSSSLGGAVGGGSIGGSIAGYSGGQTAYPSNDAMIGLIQNQGAIDAGQALATGNAYASIPTAFLAGLGAYAGLGGFSNNIAPQTNPTSGLTMPYHTGI